MPGLIVFATPTYQYMLEAIRTPEQYVLTRTPPPKNMGEYITETFPDGERYFRVTSRVHGENVVLIGGTPSDAATLELFDLASTLVEQGARRLTLIVPYFGYSTMERATKPGECVTAKHRARLLSSIPQAHYGNQIVLFDLHTEGLPYYFEGPTQTHHLYGKNAVKRIAQSIAHGRDFVLASTDAGRAKWVESLANDLNVDAAFILKRRISGTETKISGISANVKGKPVIIYDDMIRTGSSLMKAAQAYLDAGATEVSAIATHGILPGNSFYALAMSDLFHNIVVTDSHPNAVAMASKTKTLQIESIAGDIRNFLAEFP